MGEFLMEKKTYDPTEYDPIEQRKIKPKIEDILPIYLDGDNLIHALDFIAFLREYKMNPGWRSPNSWCVNYKGKVVVYIKLGKAAYLNSESDFWQMVFQSHFNDECKEMFNERFKEIARSKIRYCNCCTDFKCAPGVQASILGKELDKNICCHMSLIFNNPDAEEVKCIKMLTTSCKESIIKKLGDKNENII